MSVGFEISKEMDNPFLNYRERWARSEGNMLGTSSPEDLENVRYHVADLYSDGIILTIAKSETFSTISLMVISMNAIYIGVDADLNNAENALDAGIGFQVAEHVFATFFVSEWVIRFNAFKDKRDCDKLHSDIRLICKLHPAHSTPCSQTGR